VQQLCGEKTQKARVLLRRKVGELADYFALRSDGSMAVRGIDSAWTSATPGSMSVIPGSQPSMPYNAEVQALTGIPEIQPAVWAQLSLSQRAQALQKVEDTVAAIQGRPSVPVIAVAMADNQYGCFDGSVIRVNVNHLKTLSVNDCVDTVLHEGRHAYQRYAVDHPGFHFDPVEVRNWSDNFSHYRSATLYGYAAYSNQPLEASARQYASSILNRVY